MNKKELFESIMKNVSREVKKALNENQSIYGETPEEEAAHFAEIYFEDSIKEFAESFCNIFDDNACMLDMHDAAEKVAEVLKEKISSALLEEWEENH